MTGRAEGVRRRVPPVSDAAKARMAGALLWALVVAGALGGVTSLVTSAPETVRDGGEAAPPKEGSALAAAGWAERYVAAYLAASGDDPDSEATLARYVGYTPDLPTGQQPSRVGGSPSAVEVEEQGGVWAVTVGEAGRESYWQVTVTEVGGRLVATGLPTPVAAPAAGESPESEVAMVAVPPVGDPVVEAVTGWLGAYACGQGDVTRYLAPEAVVEPVVPAVCDRARVERWGSAEQDDGRLVVVADVALISGEEERLATVAVGLALRAGRWEVEAALPGPPVAGNRSEEAAE